ncbi:GL19743 [Drosophila persimilis]|uniref:GL19743 n=1 Tax=Drosophila persimilis TaxID=7234 RepID=B4HB48_DROPE|nr:GL19743 [Drosophila persimilis]
MHYSHRSDKAVAEEIQRAVVRQLLDHIKGVPETVPEGGIVPISVSFSLMSKESSMEALVQGPTAAGSH